MRFVKMHGAGNDYVYVDGFAERVDDPSAVAQRVVDRHTGVGADGLILVLPPDPAMDGFDTAAARMQMFNADGSEGAMCGNGIRCVCKLVHDDGLGPRPTASPMVLQTASGSRSLAYERDAHGKVARVTVDMGAPQFAAEAMPVVIDGVASGDRVIDFPLGGLVPWDTDDPQGWPQRAGLDERMTCVSMGNPHAVLFCRDLAPVPLADAGRALEGHAMFPGRANVHFVQVLAEDRARVLHWERGSGATQACGTGACAVAVAGAITGRTARRVVVETPGGPLDIDWRDGDQDRNRVFMTGPAVEVFRGQLS
ncbi:MAG: diaminopimelate epimerase [Planctomycetota bacterium]